MKTPSRTYRLASRCLLAFAACLALLGCKDDALPPLPPRPVLATTLVPVTHEVFGPFASTVEARYQTQLGFQLSGRMIARDVYIGDRVSAGQRLAAIDPTVTQFNLKRAKADVADARAQLANAEGIESRQRILAQGGTPRKRRSTTRSPVEQPPKRGSNRRSPPCGWRKSR